MCYLQRLLQPLRPLPEPRSTRKPETFTIGGLLLKGNDDFYQTIGRNPKHIPFTTLVSPNNDRHNRKASPKTKGIKSVTWATAKPPKELVLNSNNVKINETGHHAADNIMNSENRTANEGKGEAVYAIMKDETAELERKAHDFTIKDQKAFDRKTEYRNGLKKINSEVDKKIALRSNDQYIGNKESSGNLKVENGGNSATTTRASKKTAVLQSKANTSNKDIMWGKYIVNACRIIKGNRREEFIIFIQLESPVIIFNSLSYALTRKQQHDIQKKKL